MGGERAGRPDPGVAGSWVVVTGGAKGLGLCLALQYAKWGARLLLVGRDESALSEAKRRVMETGAQECRALAADVSTVEGCDAVREAALELTPLAYFIHNAGVGQAGPVRTCEDAFRIHTLNTCAPSALSATVPARLHIFISSPQAFIGVPNRDAYASSKAAVAHLARCMRSEGRPALVAYPGWIRTGLRSSAVGGGDAVPVANHPSARHPGDVAAEICAAARDHKSSCCLTLKMRAAGLLQLVWPAALRPLVAREYRQVGGR